jgi:DNA-binding response OmpR family regulator
LSDISVNENRLMVMDDDPDVGTFFGQVGEDLGFDVRVISEPANFAVTVLVFSPTVLLLDLQMPGRDGIELLRELASLERNPKVLIASGLDSRVLTSAAGGRARAAAGSRRGTGSGVPRGRVARAGRPVP